MGGRISIMRLAAQLAHEPSGYFPRSTSPVIHEFVCEWGGDDSTLDDRMFAKLEPYAKRVLNTCGSRELENRRAWLALDWLIRTNTVAWVRLAGLTRHADALANLAPQLSVEALTASAAVRDAAKSLEGYAARVSCAEGRGARWLDWDVCGAGIDAAYGAAAGSAACSSAVIDECRDGEYDPIAAADAACDVQFAAEDAMDLGCDCASEACFTAAAALVEERPSAQVADVRIAGYRALTAVVELLQASAFALLDQMIELSE